MPSTVATTVAWPANTATPPPGWDRLTDTDGTQPSGWFTLSHSGSRGVVKGYPSWDDAPWDIPADLRYHDEDDEYAVLRCRFDLTYTTYLFPDLATTAGPSTHSFGNLDFCGGWQHPITAHDDLPESDALLARVLSGTKPTGLLWGSDADGARWAEAAQAAGLKAQVYRNWNTNVWIAPGRLGDRVNRRALRATWHAVTAGDPDRARANRLLNVIDRGLERAFDLDLQQPPVQRGAVMQAPWWDEHTDEGWVVLGAVLGYPPATTYARLTGN